MARKTLFALGAALALCGALAPRALACGCFTPPDPSVPLVQAGERIVFAMKDGVVTAHIQIQFSGNPGDFGWLLPLPAVPVNKAGQPGIDLGSEELFTQLINTTQPKYRLQRNYDECSSAKSGGGDTLASGPGASPTPNGPESPLIARSVVGKYDVAVLDGKDLAAVRDWMAKNRFGINPSTYDVAGPYAHPGAYFVAVKMTAGATLGDLQPVVVRYRSDYPMIPLVLTSVSATRDMGVQVWMLGTGRAIPRNYNHTVINDAQIDWFNAGQNYTKVITKAVGEAPAVPGKDTGKHSFVTEYAGTSTIVQNLLDPPGRFSNIDNLSTVKDPVLFVETLLQSGGRPPGPGPAANSLLTNQLAALLSEDIPEPRPLTAQGVTLLQYYQNLRNYLSDPKNSQDIQTALMNFDPTAVVMKIDQRIVTPTLDAGALLRAYPYLTRLYTTISPEDMNKDPVFSYNPSLKDYSNVHQATLTYHCNSSLFGGSRYSSATLVTESGWRIEYSADDANKNAFAPLDLPYSQRTEILGEVGDPQVVVDNTDRIRQALSPSGCAMGGARHAAGAAGTAGLLFALIGLILVRARRRRG